MLWLERKFKLQLPVEMFPNVLERLRGTPARLEHKLQGVDRETLIRKAGDKWSLQEQVGHLCDCWILWDGRLTDYENKLDELTPADLSGSKTNQANHNAAELSELLTRFRTNREGLIARFEKFGIEGAGQVAHHPRLDMPMRVIDLAEFIAEHDDHHLTMMTGILKAGR